MKKIYKFTGYDFLKAAIVAESVEEAKNLLTGDPNQWTLETIEVIRDKDRDRTSTKRKRDAYLLIRTSIKGFNKPPKNIKKK